MDRDTLLIDFDGTICATESAVRYSLEAVLLKHALIKPHPNSVRDAIGSGLSLRQTFRNLNCGASLSDQDLVALEQDYREIYSLEGCRLERLYPRAELALKECTRHAKLIVLSNKGYAAIETALCRFGLETYITSIVAENPGVPRKPDPRLFEFVRESHPCVRRESSLVVGDTEVDLLFGLRAELACCWAAYGYGNRAKCSSIGFQYEINSLAALPSVVRTWSTTRS